MIELHFQKDGDAFLIFVRHIESVQVRNGVVHVFTVGDDEPYTVREGYDEVKSLIAAARQDGS